MILIPHLVVSGAIAVSLVVSIFTYLIFDR